MFVQVRVDMVLPHAVTNFLRSHSLPPIEITTRDTTNPRMEESAALQIISFPNPSTGGTALVLNPEAAAARTGSFSFFAVLRPIHDVDFEGTESRELAHQLRIQMWRVAFEHT